jgi:DICT domain-containing protein
MVNDMSPNVTIDPSLSVYNLVQRTKQQRTLLNHRRTMSIISYEIENVVIVDHVKSRIFAGFQFMSRFLRQAKRYEKLAQSAESVYVFGVMDTQPPPIPNIRYIPLKATDQLAKEWFLVSDSPDYFSALATEELSSIQDPDEKRVFQGVWAFDEDIVTILQEWLTSLVDARPLTIERRNYRKQVSLMSDTMGRLTARLAKSIERPTPQIAIINQEVRAVLEQQVIPAIPDTKKSTVV